MTDHLKETIDDIAEKIRQKRFRSEADVRLSIVQRVLRGLGWPDHDPGIVRPEFGVGNARRVDYALCAPPDTPVVLVEVKKLGAADVNAEHQLFSYCVLKGVPVAVLTDGKTWNFFLPAGAGSFEERRFCRIDLRADESTQCAEMLSRYLKYDAVKSGQNVKLAQQDLDTRRFRHACKAVWNKLFRGPADDVLNLFMEALGDEAAIDPSRSAVADWIRKRAIRRPLPPRPGPGPDPDPVPPPPPVAGQCSVTFFKDTTYHRSGIDMFVHAFTRLAERDEDFLRRYSEKYVGHKKKRVAKTRHEIHLESADRRGRCRSLPGGWWIDSHLSHASMEQWIRQACDEAGITFGDHLKISFSGQPPVPPKPKPARRARRDATDTGHWVEFRGERYAARNGIEVLVRAFTLLAEDDRTFCQRYSDRYKRKTRDRKFRPRVARTRSEIHPNDEARRERCRSLPGDWWIDSNVSNRSKRVWIEQACGLTRFRFGKDLRIHFPGESGDGS